MQTLEFGRVDVACLQIIRGYCLAGGQVEEKEPCAKFSTLNAQLRLKKRLLLRL